MLPDDRDVTGDTEQQVVRPGRPKLGCPRRVRITTTIEPSKLTRLREHARRENKSLGQLADEYVASRFCRDVKLPEAKAGEMG